MGRHDLVLRRKARRMKNFHMEMTSTDFKVCESMINFEKTVIYDKEEEN